MKVCRTYSYEAVQSRPCGSLGVNKYLFIQKLQVDNNSLKSRVGGKIKLMREQSVGNNSKIIEKRTIKKEQKAKKNDTESKIREVSQLFIQELRMRSKIQWYPQYPLELLHHYHNCHQCGSGRTCTAMQYNVDSDTIKNSKPFFLVVIMYYYIKC